MKKQNLFKTVLLLCALIVGSVSSWAKEETIAAGTFAKTSYTEGWTCTGTGQNTTGCIIIGKNEYISTPTLDLSTYSKVTISISARRYGSLSGSEAVIDASIGDNSQGTTKATSTSVTDRAAIEFTPTPSMTAVTIVFTCTNATSAGSTHGAGIGSITITGTLPDGTATVTTIIATGITNTDIKDGLAAGSLSASVTAGGSAVAGATVTWESSDETVATINGEGVVTLVAAGSTTITASYAGDATYAASSDTYELTVSDSRADAGLSYATESQTINVGQTHAAFELANPNNLTVTYSSSDEDVATVNSTTGTVTGVAVGSATITASFAGNDKVKAGSASYTLTVKANEGLNPEGQGAGNGYSLVTDASTLANGDRLLIVAISSSDTYYAMSTTQNNNNRGVKKVTPTDGVIASIADEVQVITLEGEEDAWYFNVGEGYLYAGSNSSNHLKTEAEKDANNNAKAKIEINGETGVASIVFQGTNSRNVLQYNNTSNIFACYSSASQSSVYLYRLNESTSFDVEIPAAGWRTLVSAKNVTLPEGVKAYTVTAASDDAVTLTEVANIKANNPYLLNGAAGSCTLTLMDKDTDPVEPTGNLLQISTATTGNGEYVLANKSKGVGFYLWNGGYMGAGRVYLPSDEISEAREFIGFDFGETTGIGYLTPALSKGEGVYYNLNGQRVAQPSKGLYIVNGKKVVLK